MPSTCPAPGRSPAPASWSAPGTTCTSPRGPSMHECWPGTSTTAARRDWITHKGRTGSLCNLRVALPAPRGQHQDGEVTKDPGVAPALRGSAQGTPEPAGGEPADGRALWQDRGLVLSSTVGAPLSANNVIRAFRKIIEKTAPRKDSVPRTSPRRRGSCYCARDAGTAAMA